MGNEKKNSGMTHTVDGFAFESANEAQCAEKEAQGIAYIRAKIDMNDPQSALSMYNKIVDGQLFETAIGYAYLKEMQEQFKNAEAVDDSDIHPIHVKDHVQIIKKEIKQSGSTKKRAERSNNIYLAGAHDAPDKTRRREINVNYKVRFKIALFISAVLAICVIGMFVITSTTNNATILNYETEIINRYEDWEADLTEREQNIKEKEEELGLR